MHVPHTTCTATDVAKTQRQQRPLCARVLPCLHALCPYLRVLFLRLLQATHVQTHYACPTLLIVLAMYVIPAVFSGCYYCICGNTLTTPHALSLSLFCPTLTVCPISRLTHAWRGPPLRACHVYIRVQVYVCVSVM